MKSSSRTARPLRRPWRRGGKTAGGGGRRRRLAAGASQLRGGVWRRRRRARYKTTSGARAERLAADGLVSRSRCRCPPMQTFAASDRNPTPSRRQSPPRSRRPSRRPSRRSRSRADRCSGNTSKISFDDGMLVRPFAIVAPESGDGGAEAEAAASGEDDAATVGAAAAAAGLAVQQLRSRAGAVPRDDARAAGRRRNGTRASCAASMLVARRCRAMMGR